MRELKRTRYLLGPIQKNNPFVSNLIIELVILAVICAGFVLVMVHIDHTAWQYTFFNDSDSLTLPVIQKSVQLHEPIQWVFSAQLNLFPEGLLYIIAALSTHSYQATLVLNALINIFVFYGLIRLTLRLATRAPLRQRQIFGVLTMLILYGLMLLETPAEYGQALITYMLFSTYYTGPLFFGIFNVVVIAYFLSRSNMQISNKVRWCLAVIMVATSLAVASNPLYILQFVVPLAVALFFLNRLKMLPARHFIWICAFLFVPAIVGLVVQQMTLKAFIGQPIGSHIVTSSQLLNLRPLEALAVKVIAPAAESNAMRLRISLSVGLYFVTLFVTLFMLRKASIAKTIPSWRIDKLFIVLLVLLQPIVMFLLMSLSSMMSERYMIASIIIPLLIVPLLADTWLVNRYKRFIIIFTISASIIVLILGCFYTPKFTRIGPGRKTDEACLNRALDNRPANGIADYWVARSLDIYNNHNQRILQVEEGPEVYAWLDNLATYQNKRYTFYVLQRDHNLTPLLNRPIHHVPQDFTSISPCRNFFVYHYAPGSKGYKDLNQAMKTSLANAERARRTGMLNLSSK